MDTVLHKLVTDTEITLWWEKPENTSEQYRVSVDGKPVETVEKTHVTLKNLEPDTEYLICVEPFSERGGSREEKNCGGTDDVEKTDAEKGCVERIRTGKRKRRLDVTMPPYWAKGDGVTLNTAALQKALDDCTGADVVYFPAGVFLTGALRLHSDTELYLEEGAVLQGTDCIEDYLPRIPSRFEGLERECYSSLLNIGYLDHTKEPDCQNILIHGHGVISGGGRTLAERMIEDEREKLKDYIASLGDLVKECENDNTIPGRVRPRLINMSNCRNVRISGLTLQNGPCWNVHMIYSDFITTDHCTFRSEHIWNGDGWDPDSSTNCTLFACTFYTGDDAVAIKSGKNPEGNVINRPCGHIRIFDCVSAFGHGICMGSEMSGGISDVKIWDCDLRNSMCGLEIKGTKKRGGYVRGIQVRDCSLPRILIHSVGYNDDGIAAPEPPVFEDMVFERVFVSGQYLGDDRSLIPCPAIDVEGFDEPGHAVRNILFKDMELSGDALQKILLRDCEEIKMEGVKVCSR